MNILITGIGGFVGGHLARHLAESYPDAAIHGIGLHMRPELVPICRSLHKIDLRDEMAVREVLDDTAPDAIYHLAAQSFVPASWRNPWDTLATNIGIQTHMLHALALSGARPRFLVVSSSEIYGAVRPDVLPVNEDAPLKPNNPYSVSKAAQDMLGLQYFLSHDIPVIRVRAFNHIGPGQSTRFVAPAFASQIAEIEAAGCRGTIRVGNLSAARDFTDVRDVVRAYRLLMKKGEPGEAYNVGSGVAHPISELLDLLLEFSAAQIAVKVDPERLRPSSVPRIVCDNGKLRARTGWQPEHAFAQSLFDILSECRRQVLPPQKE
jgi:GDP-4-dehydro-6-deoxy-D-mannose reductase